MLPSTVVRKSFNVSFAPKVTDLLSGVEGLNLEITISLAIPCSRNNTKTRSSHLFFTASPTPAPLVTTETVASSKLQDEAADTIAALESRSEDTKLWMTLIVFTGLNRVDGGAGNVGCLETDVSVSFAKTASAFSGARPPMSSPRVHQHTLTV